MQGRSKAPLWKLILWIEATALVAAPAAAELAGAKAISELKKRPLIQATKIRHLP